MNETHPQDEILFDRLVDGELSSEERRRLLASLDDRPGGWRQCALAFLEAQSWRTDLGQLAKEVNVAPPQPQSASVAGVSDRFARRRAASWLAIAAGLLVAFGLGWLSQNGADNLVDDGVDSVQQIANAPPRSTPNSTTKGRPNDALTFYVRDGAGGSQPVSVPLVEASALDRELGVKFRPGLPENVRQHLERNGYNVKSTQRYAPLWLENGHSLVVPVEDTKIVPISPEVY